MYLRHCVRRKNGKRHTYWRLVRSVRRNGKVVQESVAQLGELDAEGRAKARALARQITGRGEQRELFEAPAAAEASAKVRLDRIRVERGRSFGDVWLGWTLWQALRLDTVCEELLPRGREEVPWAQMAAVLVLARLCEPSSELHIAEDFHRRRCQEHTSPSARTLRASNVRGGDRPPDTVGDHPRSSCAFSSCHEACGSADHSSIRASKAIASFGPARGHILVLVLGPLATAGTKSSAGCFPSTLCPGDPSLGRRRSSLVG